MLLKERLEAFLHLHDDASWHPYLALQLHSFATISFFVFISATQAFLITSQYNVPLNRIGFVSGQLSLADEITSIFALAFWGIISDRIGRRTVLALGYAISALGLFTIPVGTNWDPDLVLTRIVFAIGTSALASILTAMLGDVVAPKGLPRASSMMGIMSGLGALCAAYGYLRLGSVTCLRTTYFIVAGICVLFGVVVTHLYKNFSTDHHSPSVREALRGVAEIPVLVRKDPNLGLALISSFAARAGSIVTSLYLSSWFAQYMVLSGECPVTVPAGNATQSFCGLSDRRCAAAVAASSSANGIVQVVALISAPFVGLALERLLPHPRWGVLCSGFIGVISYCSVAAVKNPRSSSIYGVAVAMGLSQISMVISAQVFLVRQTPKTRLGAFSGVFSLIGALGVIMIGVWGGDLFDSGFFQGPFVLTGAVYGILFVIAVLVIALFPVRNNNNGPERTSDSITSPLASGIPKQFSNDDDQESKKVVDPEAGSAKVSSA